MSEGWLNVGVVVLSVVGIGWLVWREKGKWARIVTLFVGTIVVAAPFLFSLAPYYSTGIIGLSVIVLEIRQYFTKPVYEGVHMVFEGGGIRRGLSTPQVAVLMSFSDPAILTLALIDLLQKGFVSIQPIESGGIGFELGKAFELEENVYNPTMKYEQRKNAAFEAKQMLLLYEDHLLELIDQNGGKAISEWGFELWYSLVQRETSHRLNGYDDAATLIYYQAYISHRIDQIWINEDRSIKNIGWLILASWMDGKPAQEARERLKNLRPEWLPQGEEMVNVIEAIQDQVS